MSTREEQAGEGVGWRTAKRIGVGGIAITAGALAESTLPGSRPFVQMLTNALLEGAIEAGPGLMGTPFARLRLRSKHNSPELSFIRDPRVRRLIVAAATELKGHHFDEAHKLLRTARTQAAQRPFGDDEAYVLAELCRASGAKDDVTNARRWAKEVLLRLEFSEALNGPAPIDADALGKRFNGRDAALHAFALVCDTWARIYERAEMYERSVICARALLETGIALDNRQFRRSGHGRLALAKLLLATSYKSGNLLHPVVNEVRRETFNEAKFQQFQHNHLIDQSEETSIIIGIRDLSIADWTSGDIATARSRLPGWKSLSDSSISKGLVLSELGHLAYLDADPYASRLFFYDAFATHSMVRWWLPAAKSLAYAAIVNRNINPIESLDCAIASLIALPSNAEARSLAILMQELAHVWMQERYPGFSAKELGYAARDRVDQLQTKFPYSLLPLLPDLDAHEVISRAATRVLPPLASPRSWDLVSGHFSGRPSRRRPGGVGR